MRILLTQPSSRFALKDVVGMKTPPLGLAYIAAVAERAGVAWPILAMPLRLDDILPAFLTLAPGKRV